MHIVYAVTTCSDPAYENLFRAVKIKPAFQSQKYHRLLIEGLARSAQVDVVASLPVNRSNLQQSRVRLPDERTGGADYHYVTAYRNPVRKLLACGFGTFFKTLKYCKKDSAVVVDCLNRTAALSGLLAARLKGRPCVGIVTDLPDMLGGGRFSKGLANFVIRHCTHHVFLTEAMNGYYGLGKPYVVLEGQSDIGMAGKIPSLSRKASPRVCLYAGGVSRQYGLPELVRGFQMADLPDAELRIYGPGDYVPELQSLGDPRIRYGGMLLSSEIVDKEQQATLLVNPRPTGEAYVQYSFPSKTMEYMASGTPVLTTVLPGMPREYYPYVYFIRQETAEGICAALQQVLSQDQQTLFEKGSQARQFVLENRNNVVQAKKILEMLEGTGR